MPRELLCDKDKDVLEEKVYTLLESVGMRFEHEEIVKRLLARGCRQGSDGRVLLPRGYLREIISSQERRQQEQESRTAPQGPRRVTPPDHSAPVVAGAFSPGPTRFYDYRRQRTLPANTQILEQMVKLCEATPEVGSQTIWFRQDVPHPIEVIDSLILGLKLSKKMGGIDSEKAILDRCHEMWQENLKRYEPPAWERDKLKALDDLLARAKRELLQ